MEPKLGDLPACTHARKPRYCAICLGIVRNLPHLLALPAFLLEMRPEKTHPCVCRANPAELTDTREGPEYQALLPEVRQKPSAPTPQEARWLQPPLLPAGSYGAASHPAPLATHSVNPTGYKRCPCHPCLSSCLWAASAGDVASCCVGGLCALNERAGVVVVLPGGFPAVHFVWSVLVQCACLSHAS